MNKKYGIKIIADNFNDLFKQAIKETVENGEWTKPRGLDCKEILSPQLILTNPLGCLVTLEKRKLNYAYLIIEKFSYLSQISRPDILIAYNKKMKDYLNQTTGDFDGAYGLRIAKNNQLDYCYNQLKKDKDSRQAVITINDYTDRHISLDKPCTLSLQFLIRNNKLDLIVTMRSNDLLWGASLDFPAFCFLQETMAFWLGIEVGVYIHNPASFHYYKEFEEKIISYLDEEEVNDEIIPKWDISYEDTHAALVKFWISERYVREYGLVADTGFDTINEYIARLNQYWINKNI